MKTLNLSVCGGDPHSLEEVAAVKTPSPTETWFPIPHKVLIDAFLQQAEKNNLVIEQSYFTLARFGQRFFGLFQIANLSRPDSDRIGTVVGLRNSTDKSFPAGICAGDAPFVCTNLIFSNEITLGRRHTLNIMADLPKLISRAIGQLGSHWANQDRRNSVYRSYPLGDVEAHHLILQAYRNGAITKTQIADVADQWHRPEHEEDFGDRNGYSLYGAFANVLRGNISALNNRSDALHGVLDLAFGLTAVDIEAEVVA